MTRPPARLPDGPRISDLVTLGVLTTTVPAALIDAVLVATQRQSQRHRQLPAPLVVYYVMALALYAQASYGEVLRCLLEGVRWLRLGGLDALGRPSQPSPVHASGWGSRPCGSCSSRWPTPLRTLARPERGTVVAGWLVSMARPSTCRIRRNWRPSSAAPPPRGASAASRSCAWWG